MLLRYLAIFFIFLFSFSLQSCYKLNYFIKDNITKDPPPPRHIDSDANLYFVADLDINPNEAYIPSPVPITLVQLSDNNSFLMADANMLINNPEQCLGDSALEYYHFKMNPGQNRDILIRLRPQTRYLAVISKYHNPVDVKSAAVIELPKLIVKDHYYSYVTVNPYGVEFITDN